jgi:hypothetical protein
MSDTVWIHAHVEDMRETDEYYSFTRAEWDAMTVQGRDAAVQLLADEACANAGGYGASVIDAADVPDEWKARADA